MKKALLITPLSKTIPVMDDVSYIGVDAGALNLIEVGFPIEFAVGDFDSINKDDFTKIQQKCEVIVHPVQKNETDSELAIRTCIERGYEKIYLHGALTGRLDHTLANIRLLMYRYNELVCFDEDQRISVLDQGKHVLKKEYTHISFFPIEDSVITLEGFLYPLNKQDIYPRDIYCVSNSMIETEAIVTLDAGKVLCIESNVK